MPGIPGWAPQESVPSCPDTEIHREGTEYSAFRVVSTVSGKVCQQWVWSSEDRSKLWLLMQSHWPTEGIGGHRSAYTGPACEFTEKCRLEA